MRLIKTRALRFCMIALAGRLVPVPAARAQSTPAQDAARESVQAIKNPFARAYVFPVISDTGRGMGPYHRTQQTFTLQPLIPLPLGHNWDLITQTVIPVSSQPDVALPNWRRSGLNDITVNVFAGPENDKVQWGIGASLQIPSATNAALGAGKWCAGPAGAVFADIGGWTVGTVVSNVKSFTGDASRPEVNFLSLQYQITHNFWRGWYMTSSPTAIADWTGAHGDRWLVPVGLGLGNVFRIGRHHVGGEFTAYYSLVHPETQPYAKWLFSLQVTFAKSRQNATD
jgi:hypothetical protein